MQVALKELKDLHGRFFTQQWWHISFSSENAFSSDAGGYDQCSDFLSVHSLASNEKEEVPTWFWRTAVGEQLTWWDSQSACDFSGRGFLEKGGCSIVLSFTEGDWVKSTIARINLIRNPLSTRNPGVSHCWFETPPPSTVKCCLAMFLETYVRDCLSTCQGPAVCPAVNKCIALLSPFPSHHH